MTVSVIVAVSENGVIGRSGGLPWRLPDDLKRFKSLTMGHPIIMGRRTYESIGRPLPGRTSIVLTRNRDYAPPGVLTASSLEQALAVAMARGATEAFIIGGATVFAEALDRCHRILLTLVRASVEGDVFFPLSRLDAFTLAGETEHPADPEHEHPFTFRTYLRRPSPSGTAERAGDAGPRP